MRESDEIWCSAAVPRLLPLPSVGAGFDGICGLPLPREAVGQHCKKLSGSSQVCPNCSGIKGPPLGRDALS